MATRVPAASYCTLLPAAFTLVTEIIAPEALALTNPPAAVLMAEASSEARLGGLHHRYDLAA